jgi:Mg/Co/Ni transporter MgtE
VHPHWDLHRVARKMSDFNLTVLPVLDEEDGKMIGVITVDDLLEELLPQGWRREFGMTAAEE